MRGTAIFEARQRLRKVVDYIDANAEAMPSVAALAGMANLSPFHFIRFYKKYVGETPGETALRVRLARARASLARGESVTTVAFAAGYGSVQAFSHAFQRLYRQMPSRVVHGAGLPCVPPRMEWVEESAAVGIRYDGVQAGAASAFDRLVAICRASGMQVRATDVLGIVHGDPFMPADGLIRIDAVVVAPAIWPRDLDRLAVPGGLHVVLRSLGPLPSAAPELARLRARTLPHRGLTSVGTTTLCRPLRDPAITPPSERLWEVFLPMQRESAAALAAD